MLRTFGARASGERRARMLASPQWRDGAFANPGPIRPGLRDPTAAFPGVRELLRRDERRIPPAPFPAFDPRNVWAGAASSGLRATWLGHSTLLLEVDGARILTDPVWGPRASPSSLVGPRRFQPVPIALDRLGPIDAVIVSHDHYDHLDYPTIRALARTGVPFVTSLGVGAHLEAFGVAPEHITELDWWESHRVPGHDLEITAAPSQHFSGRSLRDRNATLWSSFAIRGARHRVFFSGDTGLTDAYAEIGRRLGPFDLVMIEIGAFHPSWGDVHLGPAHALEAYDLLGGGVLLQVHWGTFALAVHDWDEPPETLLRLGAGRELPLLMPRLGEPVEPARATPRVDPWWRAARERAAPLAAYQSTP